MVGIRPLLFTSLPLLVTFLAPATEIPVLFTIVDSERIGTNSFSKGDTSQQTIQHSGTINAQLTFDPSSSLVTAIRFTGANVAESAATFRNTVDVNIPGQGTKSVNFESSSSGLSLRLETEGGPHAVTSDGRILDPFRLKSYPTAGILTAKITIEGRTQIQQVDVALDPPDNITPLLNTHLSLTLLETSNRGSVSDYELSFLHTVDDRRTISLPDNNGTRVESMKGFTLSKATFTAPSAYGQWLTQNGYSLDDTQALNPHGIPLSLLFAFGLSSNTSQSLPWRFVPDASGSLALSLQLPYNGLQQAIQVEACDNLAAPAWQAVTPQDFLYRIYSLEKGATGERRIHLPDTGSIIYRIVPASTTN